MAKIHTHTHTHIYIYIYIYSATDRILSHETLFEHLSEIHLENVLVFQEAKNDKHVFQLLLNIFCRLDAPLQTAKETATAVSYHAYCLNANLRYFNYVYTSYWYSAPHQPQPRCVLENRPFHKRPKALHGVCSASIGTEEDTEEDTVSQHRHRGHTCAQLLVLHGG